MNLKYFRFMAFTSLMRPFSARSRRKRMRDYVALMGVTEGMSVLDLRGRPMIWDIVRSPLDITILNLPGVAEKKTTSHHRIRYVEGDACGVVGFKARQFDSVFSNSVIEHVGPAVMRGSSARQIVLGANSIQGVSNRSTLRHALLVVLSPQTPPILH